MRWCAATSGPIAALAAGLLACATEPVEQAGFAHPPLSPEEALARVQTGPEAERTPDGLVRALTPENPRMRLYVRPPGTGPVSLARYGRILLAPARISYMEGVRSWSESAERRLREHFDDAIRRELARGTAWKITDEPGDRVLRVAIAALELDVETSPSLPTSSVHYVTRSGKVTLILELSDSVSGAPVLRSVERRELPGGIFSGSTSDVEFARLTLAFDRFASDLGLAVKRFYAAAQRIEQYEQTRDGG